MIVISNCVTWELFSRVKAGIPIPVKHLPDLTHTRGYGSGIPAVPQTSNVYVF